MWELVFVKYLFAIYRRGNDYKVVVDGHKKFFRGETAKADMERWIRDNDWTVWCSLCNHNADW